MIQEKYAGLETKSTQLLRGCKVHAEVDEPGCEGQVYMCKCSRCQYFYAVSERTFQVEGDLYMAAYQLSWLGFKRLHPISL